MRLAVQNSGQFKTGDYDFCLFRIPENGGRVLWQITNSCNYSCSYCIFASGPEKINRELNTDEVKRAINSLKEKDFRHVKFTGGEPFVRRDMLDILEYAAANDFVVDVSTNASLITPEKAQRISDIGLNMVHVSVDGHQREIHEAIRGEGTYDSTLNGLQSLTDKGIYVRVGTVLCTQNDSLLKEMVQFCADNGVKEIVFSLMQPAGRMAGDYSLVTKIPSLNITRGVEELSRKYKGKIKVRHNLGNLHRDNSSGICPGATKFIYIDNLGRVSPCTWVSEHSNKYDNNLTLKENTLDEVMQSPSIRSYLGRIEEARAQGITGCPLKWKESFVK